MNKLLLLTCLALFVTSYASADEYLDTDNHGDYRGFSTYILRSDDELRERYRLEKTIAEFVMTNKEHRITMLSARLAKMHKNLSHYLDTTFSGHSYLKMIVVNTYISCNHLNGSITANLYKNSKEKTIVDVVRFVLIKEGENWKLGPIEMKKSFYILPISVSKIKS